MPFALSYIMINIILSRSLYEQLVLGRSKSDYVYKCSYIGVITKRQLSYICLLIIER